MTIGAFIIVIIHGIKRYGARNMLAFFLITWLISNFFESLSIMTGFPFGFYNYVNMEGPRIFGVPITITFSYFALGYLSWMLSHILTGQYDKKLEGKHTFIIPIIAAFIMVMWDLCMDPIASTIYKLWIWTNPGDYYGVPITNYFGWFLVTYLFFQAFALFISKYDKKSLGNDQVFTSKSYWIAVTIVYILQATYGVIYLQATKPNMYIYVSMGLITIFTTLFVSILTIVMIINNNSLIIYRD